MAENAATPTYTSSIALRNWLRLGIELFKEMSAFSKSVGIVTFSNDVRLGMLNCGTLMFPKGLTLLMAPIAVWIAEFADDTSFWIPVRMLLIVLWMKLLIYKKVNICAVFFYYHTHFLNRTD